MFRIPTLALFASMLISAAPAPAAACTGSNPAITDVRVQSVVPQGRAMRWTLAGTVVNQGTEGQPTNVLQSVAIYAYGQKLDQRSIPPLRAGQTFSFIYPYMRAFDAGKGTTTLDFRIVMEQGQNCNPANGTYTIRF